jgi:molybdopterin-guanine dinucleotide biosynthesis protein A
VPYRIVILQAARDQLRDAPPHLLGSVDGVLAVLRVDPDTATTAFDMRIVDDELREVIYAGGQGMLGIWALKEQQIIAVTHVTWIG